MKKFQTAITKLPTLLICIYVCIFLTLLLCAVLTNAPRELRDAANVAVSTRLAHMQNPYVLSTNQDFIEYVNVYPPLNMLIAAFIYFLTDINLYRIFYSMDFIYVVASAAAIAYFLKKALNIPSFFIVFLSFAGALTLGWRTGFISTVPDHLGMLICIILLICAHKNKSILLQAVLSVLAFYSKQYFLAIAASVFLFHCLSNIKTALKYFLYTAVIGILSFLVICLFCPSFSVQIIYFMFAENDSMNVSKILYTGRQMFLALATYGIFSLFVLKRYIHAIRIRISGEKINLTVFDIHFMLMFFVLLYLGTNKGAFLSYHLTLIIPCVIVTGAMEMHIFLQTLDIKAKYPAQLLICIISLALLYKKYQFPYVYTDKDYQQYSYVENILEQYSGDEVYLVPQLGFYTLEHSKMLAENGHHDYIISLADSKIINTPIDITATAHLFPYIVDLYEYSVFEKEEILDSVKNQKFALITRQNGSTMLYGYDISSEYTCIDSVPVRTGIQNYTVDLWIPKK